MLPIDVISISVSIHDFKNYFEEVLGMRARIECLDDGREHAEIRAPEVFRSVLYPICSGINSINRIDQLAKDKDILSVTGTKQISARTIGRSFAGMRVEQLVELLSARSRAEIAQCCNPQCKAKAIFDMSQQFGKKAVVATYYCKRHLIIATIGVEFLTEAEAHEDERKKGEGESKAATRLLPRVEKEFGRWIYEYTADGYYTYWFAELIRKYKKHFTLKTHEENLQIVQQAHDQIEYLYYSGVKAERLTPASWISEDRYKAYEAFDTDFITFHSDTGKSPYDGKEYRIVMSVEKYLSKSQRKRATETVYTMTSIPSWEAPAKEIVQTRRDEWRIEVNVFKELSEKMASKLGDHFFKINDNSKKCVFIVALIARDLLYGYRRYKIQIPSLTARHKKDVTIIRISRCLLNTWLPKKSGAGRPRTRIRTDFINIHKTQEPLKRTKPQPLNN